MDIRTWTLVLNTLLLTGATCAISLPLGTVAAWLLVRTDLPGRRIALALVGLMLFVPLYLHVAAWQAGFALQGWYTLACGGTAWLDGFSGAVWVHSMAAVPWVVLIVGVGLWLVEPELEESALLDGRPRQVFLQVTLRGALPAVGLAALWVAVSTAGEMTVTDLFGVRTYAEEVYTRIAVGQKPGDAPLGLLPGMAITALLVVAALVFCAGLAPGERPISLRRRLVSPSGRLKLPLTVLVAVGVLLLVGLPIGNLCYKAGVVVSQAGELRVRSWSAGKFLLIVATAPWRYRRELGTSLSIGALSATAAVAAAVPLAWLARRGGLRSLPALLVTALCLAVPGPLLGLAIIHAMNRPDIPWLLSLYDGSILAPALTWFFRGLVTLYDRSILAPTLAWFFRGLPAATLILWHALRTVPPELLESAAVDGAGPVGRLWRVALPMRLPAVGVAWLVALAMALGDLAACILVVPPGVTTLSIRIFGLLHYGVEDQVAGICLALVVMFAAVAGAVAWLAKRWRRCRAAE